MGFCFKYKRRNIETRISMANAAMLEDIPRNKECTFHSDTIQKCDAFAK